jgi:hypothetical protein
MNHISLQEVHNAILTYGSISGYVSDYQPYKSHIEAVVVDGSLTVYAINEDNFCWTNSASTDFDYLVIDKDDIKWGWFGGSLLIDFVSKIYPSNKIPGALARASNIKIPEGYIF